jgi:hypothetical protein
VEARGRPMNDASQLQRYARQLTSIGRWGARSHGTRYHRLANFSLSLVSAHHLNTPTYVRPSLSDKYSLIRLPFRIDPRQLLYELQNKYGNQPSHLAGRRIMRIHAPLRLPDSPSSHTSLARSPDVDTPALRGKTRVRPGGVRMNLRMWI